MDILRDWLSFDWISWEWATWEWLFANLQLVAIWAGAIIFVLMLLLIVVSKLRRKRRLSAKRLQVEENAHDDADIDWTTDEDRFKVDPDR